MEDIEVSVVIAFDAHADRIPTLLLHLEQQTFPASRMEAIIADAGHNRAVRSAAEKFGEGSPMRSRAVRDKREGILAALNKGVAEARGRIVILLDQDLLPSPKLVKAHYNLCREQGRSVVSVGHLLPHPQLGKNALTAWFMSDLKTMQHSGDLEYLDWRRANMACYRESILAAEGFDEAYDQPPFADADLAHRLQRAGATAKFNGAASAYISYDSSFPVEYQRHYAKGCGLRRLYQRTGDQRIMRRYTVKQHLGRRLLDWFFVPFYVRACRSADTDTALLGHVYRRVFQWQRHRGWADTGRAFRNRS